MPNFKDILAETKTDHEALKAKEKAARDTISSALASKEQAAIDLLEREVVPLLNQAARDIGDEGIKVEIVTKYDVMNRAGFAKPSVTFCLLGPVRPGDGYQIKAPAVSFAADDQGNVHVEPEFARSGTRDRPVIKSGNGQTIESTVVEGIKVAYQHYLDERPGWELLMVRRR